MPIIAASIAAPSRKVEEENSKNIGHTSFLYFGYQFIFELISIISNRVLRNLSAIFAFFCDLFDF
jgi:hypothetical protein